MQIRRTTGSGPYAHVIYIKKDEVDKICVDELRKSGYLPTQPGPINIELFIEKYLECTLDFATELGGGVLGYTVFDPKKGKPMLVGVSPKLDDGTKSGERRIRATLAHEAGHCILHPILFMDDAGHTSFDSTNIDFAKRRILCRDSDFKTPGKYDGRWWEFQANCAIGGFLLPKKLVACAVAAFLNPVGSLGVETLLPNSREKAIDAVAGLFEVNPVVARIRLTEMYPETAQQEL